MSSVYPPNGDNGRVTNAILATKLDALTNDVRRLGDVLDRRIGFLEEKLDIRICTVENECQANTTNIARLDERQKATTGILGGMTLIGSIIAGAFGSLVK